MERTLRCLSTRLKTSKVETPYLSLKFQDVDDGSIIFHQLLLPVADNERKNIFLKRRIVQFYRPFLKRRVKGNIKLASIRSRIKKTVIRVVTETVVLNETKIEQIRIVLGVIN